MSDEVKSAETGEPAEVDRSPSPYDRWLAVREREVTVAALTFLGVFLAPFVLVALPEMLGIPTQYVWYRSLVTLALIWGIFAIGYDLLLGFTGLLSFGHAMFWGVAAYAAGIFSANVTGSPIAMILVGTTVSVLLAWVIGWISLRRGGIYFAILTLAFGQMIYYIFLSPLGWLTGGENGFNEVAVDPLLGFLPLGAEVAVVPDILVETWMYVFVGLAAVLAVVVANRVLNSPYGIVLRAVRENEQRAEFVGLNVWRYKLMAFVISGAFAGVAGSLYVIQRSFVPIENTLNWTVSGEIVIMTVLGGVGSLFGPILGAGLYMYVANIVSGMPGIGHFWHMILGLVFVFVVVLLPDGIWGGITWLRERVGDALGGDER
ncbi:branched-chain amino acid ABC transporter permease [Halosimplex pelagicum]|uniref:Branched-chain amino acid ABC transporter permease n=1 Tax=Halosimplex pelagicum TaxID=869886 RepID=A0A7D5TAH8_9EURY|nr:branched-chain amino acid ABC transporter permease [Halosimplex pelagicum]QLH82750.1 branched-chain amino acid ABC transporter permease [Halosimplex pelagicum]